MDNSTALKLNWHRFRAAAMALNGTTIPAGHPRDCASARVLAESLKLNDYDIDEIGEPYWCVGVKALGVAVSIDHKGVFDVRDMTDDDSAEELRLRVCAAAHDVHVVPPLRVYVPPRRTGGGHAIAGNKKALAFATDPARPDAGHIHELRDPKALTLALWRRFFSKPCSRNDALEVASRAAAFDAKCSVKELSDWIQRELYAAACAAGWTKLTGKQRRRLAEEAGAHFAAAWQRRGDVAAAWARSPKNGGGDARRAQRLAVSEATYAAAHAPPEVVRRSWEEHAPRHAENCA